MSVKDNIITLRSISGLTQEEFAKVANVSRAAVSLWEIGKSEPRMGAIERLANHFRIKKANIIEDGGMDGAYLTQNGSVAFHDLTPQSLSLSPDESELVGCYRSADARGRENIMDVARRERGTAGVVGLRKGA